MVQGGLKKVQGGLELNISFDISFEIAQYQL